MMTSPVGTTRGTDHASPYTYDTHVPLAFYGLPFQVGTFRTHAEPVDLALGQLGPSLEQLPILGNNELLVILTWERRQLQVDPKAAATRPLNSVRARINHLAVGRCDFDCRVVVHLPCHNIVAARAGYLPQQLTAAIVNKEIIRRSHNQFGKTITVKIG